MAQREDLGVGSWRVRTARGTAKWIPHARRVIELEFAGYADLELVAPIMDEMGLLLDRTDGVHCFSDVLEVEGYDAEVWKAAQAWLVKHRRRMAGNYVLQASSVVEVGTRLLNLFLPQALHAYTEREDYDKKLKECLALHGDK